MDGARWLGLALLGGGAAWAAWAWVCLRSAGTPARPGARPAVLVEEGPYRYGRHPMYLGAVVALAGVALVEGSVLLALAAATGAGVAGALAPREERRLRQVFGGWYSDYAGSVRRWL